MGSYFGESNSGNGRSGSSKKGKKTSSDKPKTPQRGLGVAQLEKIRLHNQMNCSYLPSPQPPSPYPTHFNQEPDRRMEAAYSMVPPSSSPSFAYASTPATTFGYHHPSAAMAGRADMEPRDIRYGDSQSGFATRWNQYNGMVGNQYAVQPNMTRHPLSFPVEDPAQRMRREDVRGSGSQNPDSSEKPEIDLELRLGI
ncbi:Spear1-like [Thalictrum thalictroides]|uniref:Spear1-like n=1 Tax=Thalictrum thalictroides TaxID=46969 RepID=A0A7J6X6Q6_THATH|nr:Spear1-like [Thalictrum thalictroides]